jgi:ketosteroid isomerase-like protein
MSSHQNRAILERAIQAMLKGDLEGMTEAMAEDAVLEWPQSGERIIGRQACYMVYANYPGGPPTYELGRITGDDELFTVEAVGDYSGEKVFFTSIVEFQDGKIARQTDYWSNPFEAPAWRSQWVERMEPV